MSDIDQMRMLEEAAPRGPWFYFCAGVVWLACAELMVWVLFLSDGCPN